MTMFTSGTIVAEVDLRNESNIFWLIKVSIKIGRKTVSMHKSFLFFFQLIPRSTPKKY